MQNAQLRPLPEFRLSGLIGRFAGRCCDVVAGLRSQLKAGKFFAFPGPLS
jgi:hypothetical protein